MKNTKTNIFCIISNIGSRQDLYLEQILSNKQFVTKFSLDRLIYNTTKPNKKGSLDYAPNKYHYFSEQEYHNIPENEILEYRSYYTIPFQDVFYFTLKSDILNKHNLICITSAYQYENYKRWVSMENMRNPDSYSIYAILLHCSIRSRFLNKVNSIASLDNELELLEFSRRILQDNAEFNEAKGRLPELRDIMNCINTCYLDDDIMTDEVFKKNIQDIKDFIQDKCSND